MAKGFFITFEGGEGCGKSTHIARLLRHLKDSGLDCISTREPGGSPLSEKIRELLLFAKEGETMSARTEILLFEAARSQHVAQTIRPALDAGKIVVCDRFFDSTTAYQGAARKLSAEDVAYLNAFATDGLEPDLTILLDIPVAVGLGRAENRDAGCADRMGSQQLSFYEDVRAAFLRLARENPHRFAVVSSDGSRDETFAKIVAAVESRLK